MRQPFFKIAIVYTIVMVVIAIIFYYKLPAIDSSLPIDHEKFSQFGDFVGGVIGTLLTFFSIYLIYVTIQEQINQANLAKEIYEIDIMNRLYSDILSEINNLEYKSHRGIHALYNFDEAHRENPNSIMNHLCLIFILFENAISSAEQSSYLDEKRKKNELTKLFLLFYSKLIWPIYQNIYDKLYEDFTIEESKEIVKGLKRHNDSVVIFNKYKELTAKSYEYLLELKLVTLPETKPKMLAIIRRDNGLNQS